MQPKEIAPGARLDFVWPWGEAYLAEGEVIASATVTVGGGLIKDGAHQLVEMNRSVLQWLRFPAALGTRCWADCAVVTSAGREDSRRFEFVVAVRSET